VDRAQADAGSGPPCGPAQAAGPGPPGGPAQEALAARDARQALLDAHRPPAGSALVAVALNVPGPDREPPGALALQAWALSRLVAAFPAARPVHSGGDALGPFALLVVPGAPLEVKRRCVALEAAIPAARLVDLAVLGPDGLPAGRTALGLPSRPCLLCAAPAVECIRLGRHPLAAVLERVHELLSGV
jgi:holo-ACP synthase CitX